MSPDENYEFRANYYVQRDYEDEVLRIAEGIAFEETGQEFHDLCQQDAERIWKKAEVWYANMLADLAEQEREDCE